MLTDHGLDYELVHTDAPGRIIQPAKEPDDSNSVLSMLGLNSGRAERLYRSKLRECKSTEADGGPAGPWAMDGADRVY